MNEAEKEKAIADAINLLRENGYLVKKYQALPKKLPCVCGRKRTETFTGPGYYKYKCPKCGFSIKGKTAMEVRINWNNSVIAEKEKQMRLDI